MFKGCFVALVTPFRDGNVDTRALSALTDRVLAGGVNGLVPCGTTGESPTLSADERQLVIKTVVERAKGKVPVIAGTGTNSTDNTLAASQQAACAGVDGIMLVSPYYNKPNQAGLYHHFGHVASRVKIPIVLYNIPGRTGVEISIDTITKLRADFNNIVAVKHATGSLDSASALMARCDIPILCGDDTLTLPLMSLGAVGVISVVANLLPDAMTSLVQAAASGDLQAARSWHHQLFPLARDLLKLDTNPIPIKTALAIQGFMAEEFRLPLCRMNDTARNELSATLASFKAQD